MKNINIITVIGTRPQFVKASAFSREIKNFNEKHNKNIHINETLIHTGQHYDENMSEIFFNELDLDAPDITFDIKASNSSHSKMTAVIMTQLEEIFLNNKPSFVIVYGDTNTTLAASLAASKLNIKLIHIESGLRSFNREMPEEINRVLTDHVSTYLFCASQDSIKNLANEGISNNVHLVGDVMLDVNNFYIKKAEKEFDIKKYDIKNNDFVLVTLHRQESVDIKERLETLLNALAEINKTQSVIFPIHPRTKKMVKEFNLEYLLDGICLIEPVGYIEMLSLISASVMVLTDSGGLQKEAVYNNKFCVILRKETEWVEIIDNGMGIIAGYNFETIIQSYEENKNKVFNKKLDCYGKGDAAIKILSTILKDIS
jgi:UDP-GlcNAc3NAcA epimerase